MMPSNVPQKYITAYEGILNPEDLAISAREAGEFEAGIPPLKHIPGIVRQTIGRLSDEVKMRTFVQAGVKIADKAGRDYSGVVGEAFDPARHKHWEGEENAEGRKNYAVRLNHQTFILSDDGARLERSNPQEIANLFPPGNEDTWKTLVLVPNSNLTSPQAFFDNFGAARTVVSRLTDTPRRQLKFAGTYFSQRHLDANGVDTFKRAQELGIKPSSLEHITPAAEAMAYQLLDLLLERDAKGAVITANDKPVLRADAAEVLKHVVGYGYSAGHATNKDGFRILRDILDKGDMQVHARDRGEAILRDSSSVDVDRLMPHARLIGMAGMDRMQPVRERGMPQEVNFLSKKDAINALNGPKHLKAEGTVLLEIKDDDGKAFSVGGGGHAQDGMVKAFLSNANGDARDAAWQKLHPSRSRE